MSSRTKVSPRIRDQVPDGFYVDDKTQECRFEPDVAELEVTFEKSMARYPYREHPRRNLPQFYEEGP